MYGLDVFHVCIAAPLAIGLSLPLPPSRDLKPGNLFIGHGGVVKVGDLGMSRYAAQWRGQQGDGALERTLTPGEQTLRGLPMRRHQRAVALPHAMLRQQTRCRPGQCARQPPARCRLTMAPRLACCALQASSAPLPTQRLSCSIQRLRMPQTTGRRQRRMRSASSRLM